MSQQKLHKLNALKCHALKNCIEYKPTAGPNNVTPLVKEHAYHQKITLESIDIKNY